jgi:hypothetical protein
VGSQFFEQQEEWQLERRRFCSEATMAKIRKHLGPLEITDGHPEEQAAAAIFLTVLATLSIHSQLPIAELFMQRSGPIVDKLR